MQTKEELNYTTKLIAALSLGKVNGIYSAAIFACKLDRKFFNSGDSYYFIYKKMKKDFNRISLN